jgi:hypothetical protein
MGRPFEMMSVAPFWIIVTFPNALARDGQRVLGSALSSIPFLLVIQCAGWGRRTLASHRRLNSIMLGVKMILGTPFHPWTTSGSFYTSA